MNERVRMLRKTLNMTLETFGSKIGMKKNSLSQIENGVNNLTEQNILLICEKFGISEQWLRTGEGTMFKELPEEEETAVIVSDLLEDGKDNPFYEIILEIMRTYNELSPKSQEVLRDASTKLLENLQKKKEN